MAFIYKIENMVNHKKYIGKTRRTDVSVRWDEHIKALNKGNHFNSHLQNAWKKYGFANFDFSIVSEYPVDYDEKLLADAELKYIDFFDSYRNGYNMTVASIGDEEPVYWKYTVTKNGVSRQNKQIYCICNRNGSVIRQSVNKEYLESFLPLLNFNEELGLEELSKFYYNLTKMGKVRESGNQRYGIRGENGEVLITSVNKEYLEEIVELLNLDKDAGLKAISEDKFQYTINKYHDSTVKDKIRYGICSRSVHGKNYMLITSINKNFIMFVCDLLNSNESEWVVKEDGKFKLHNKKLLKELYNNYDCEVLI